MTFYSIDPDPEADNDNDLVLAIQTALLDDPTLVLTLSPQPSL